MGWEGAFLLWVQQTLRGAELNAIMTEFTHLGDGGMLFLITAVGLLCFPRTRRAGATALVALALGGLCTNVVLKHLFARPRPWLDVAGLLPLVEEGDPNSFPSGHTCAAFAFAAAVQTALPQRWGRVLAWCAAVLMGISRLYVGVHYPTDVLAGAVVGALCGLAAAVLCRRFLPEERPVPGG